MNGSEGVTKVLVLGGTGPAGICLLRELIYRNHATIVYARNPSKIPTELTSNPLLKVMEGELTDVETFSRALSACRVVLSLLGPHKVQPNINPTLYSGYYTSTVFPTMRRHGVLRIFAMGTISIAKPGDSWALLPALARTYLRYFVGTVYQCILNTANAFEQEAKDLDWTLFRIGFIPGESDEASWMRSRIENEVFAGSIGDKMWTFTLQRAALAKWLVDAVEEGGTQWVRQMPALSKLAQLLEDARTIPFPITTANETSRRVLYKEGYSANHSA